MQRVIVGISGGVDSSVAAYLLKEQGYDVIGVFMKNWEETDENGICPAEEDYADAKSVCLKLGIPFYSVNFSKEYWDNVFTYFLDEYAKGRTPNPDVLCNSEIKFKAFLNYAKKTFGADLIATGHYARNSIDNGTIRLYKGIDPKKDQSYFLSFLQPNQIASALFPLGGMYKPQVREIAQKLNLRTAEKKDSMGICFIGERNFTRFLQSYLPAQKGDMIDLDTMKKVGEHDGLMYYTIGQRRGLRIGNQGEGDRWYVCDKNMKDNILYVVQGAENPLLFCEGFVSGSVNFISELQADQFECTVKYRYQQTEKKCMLKKTPDGCEVYFTQPQSGVAPGQVGVFYSGVECLGGAIIDYALKP